MAFRTDDPIADFNRHDSKQQAWLDKLPKCGHCDHPIQQETAIYINDEWLCDDCLVNFFRKAVEDYVE